MGAPPSLLLPCNHRETVHAITRHLRDHSSWCPAIMIRCNIGPSILYPILRATLLLLPRQTFLLLNMGRERSRKILFVSKIDTWRLLANTARALHPPLAAHFLDFVHLLTLGRDFVRKVRYDNNSRPRVGRPPSLPGNSRDETKSRPRVSGRGEEKKRKREKRRKRGKERGKEGRGAEKN